MHPEKVSVQMSSKQSVGDGSSSSSHRCKKRWGKNKKNVKKRKKRGKNKKRLKTL